jgi:hypothetical protein
MRQRKERTDDFTKQIKYAEETPSQLRNRDGYVGKKLLLVLNFYLPLHHNLAEL